MAKNGADILLMVNVGTEAMPQYLAVGSQRDFSREETTEEIDASSKDSDAYRPLPGRNKSTITMDSLYIPNDESYQALKTAKRNREFILVRRQEAGGDLEEARAIITNLSRNAPDNDVATLTIGLTIDADWEEVGS